MLQTTRGLVLRTIKYQDSSLIADVYTDVRGRCQLSLRIPKTGRGKVPVTLFQPLTLLELEIDVRPHANIYKVAEAKTLQPFSDIPFNPYKQAIVMFLSEFLTRALREEEQNQPLFEYLYYSISFLDGCSAGFSNFHIVFLLRLSRFLGIYPNFENYHAGDYFDLQNATFVGLRPLTHTHYLAPEEAAYVPQLSRINFETMHLFRFSRMERSRMLAVLNEFYRLHLPDFPELNSLQVLRELFD
ncbi:MAG: DNA repair protein RecO C-terminal domain-containing protein [Bacteroidaceae bacterium]|nr:DNA repair protein RecO C-terminal domain-containing protein [Bacteroidaceae bacterium]MBR3716832.1 DNA repair protein RecO C-terminal domain-containing protein [Bacteroidaceae bacterium]